MQSASTTTFRKIAENHHLETTSEDPTANAERIRELASAILDEASPDVPDLELKETETRKVRDLLAEVIKGRLGQVFEADPQKDKIAIDQAVYAAHHAGRAAAA